MAVSLQSKNIFEEYCWALQNCGEKSTTLTASQKIDTGMVVNKLLDQERSKEGAQRKRFMLQGNLFLASTKIEIQQLQTFALQKTCRNYILEELNTVQDETVLTVSFIKWFLLQALTCLSRHNNECCQGLSYDFEQINTSWVW